MKDAEYAKDIGARFKANEKYPNRINCLIGIALTDCSREEMYAEFSFVNDNEAWLNPYGGIHGGIICTLFDTCMGFGAAGLCKGFVSTTDLSVSYLKPMMGTNYKFRIDYTQLGSRMIRCIGKAIDTDSGLLCATAQASFVITQGRAPGSRV